MTRRKFSFYNVGGGLLWVAGLIIAGYLFGNIPWVKANLSWIVVGIVVVSLIPAVSTFLKERRASQSPPRP